MQVIKVLKCFYMYEVALFSLNLRAH